MDISRRDFLGAASLGLASLALPGTGNRSPHANEVVKPPRLKPGDTIGIVSPAGITFDPDSLEIFKESLGVLGLETRVGSHVLARWGYLAGRDEERADELNRMFADPEVRGVFALHGGWGSARLLPLLDYDTIRRNPKVFMGFSDITALLIAIYARSGVVTFHGPTGNSTWNSFTVDYVRRTVFDGEAVVLQNPSDRGDNLTQVEDRIRTIRSGRARGRLAGGNLTVLSSIVGSGYLPDWDNHILFLEDINEEIYRLDRMLTQLRLAGVLERIAGFVFGRCSSCEPDSTYGSFTLEEVLADHIRPLGIPAWHGAMIGHIRNKFTVPVGVEAEIDADAGTIRLVEPAVA